MEKLILVVACATSVPFAAAGGGWTPAATAVPVDSPLALFGLVVAISLIGARILRNRKK